MTPDMIRQLPGRHALVIRGGYSPVIARLPMAWHDRTCKAERRERTRAAAPARVPDMADFAVAVAEPRGMAPGWDTDPDAVPSSIIRDDLRYPWQ